MGTYAALGRSRQIGADGARGQPAGILAAPAPKLVTFTVLLCGLCGFGTVAADSICSSFVELET
jgi:hypothetical protein